MTTEETPTSAVTRIHKIRIAISMCGHATHLIVGGHLIHGAESEGFVMEAFARSFRRETRTIVVDLGDVQKMDAAGLGFLAFVCDEVRRAGAQLLVENAPGFVRGMFRIVGLDRVLDEDATVGERPSR
jgi:anti-anti-sigma factor